MNQQAQLVNYGLANQLSQTKEISRHQTASENWYRAAENLEQARAQYEAAQMALQDAEAGERDAWDSLTNTAGRGAPTPMAPARRG